MPGGHTFWPYRIWKKGPSGYKYQQYIGEVEGKSVSEAKRQAAREFGGSAKNYHAEPFFSGSRTPSARPRNNPTKAQRKAKARKAAVERRVAAALAKFLKQANPAMKTAGATMQRLKGGTIKITPIKAAKRGRR